MIVAQLISNVIPSLQLTDTVQKALERMAEFKTYHLPVVEKHQFLGLVSEEELIEQKEKDLSLGSSSLSFLNAFVLEDAHFYDVLRLFNQFHLSLVPVLDQNRSYKGVVSIPGLLAYMAEIYVVNEPGGIIVLSVNNRNNSLAHMSQIVEADNAQILSSHVQSFPNSTKLEITLKINKAEISGIIAAFERYNYEVKAVFNNLQPDNGTADRFDSFMNYLNV